MKREELEELKKDPVKFCELLSGKTLYPHQEAILNFFVTNPKARLIASPRRFVSQLQKDIFTQTQIMGIKEDQTVIFATPFGDVTLFCLKNTIVQEET